MNFIDIIIILLAAPMLISTRHNFSYHVFNAFCVIGGYMLGFYLVVNSAGDINSAVAIGNAFIYWTFGLAIFGRILSFVARGILVKLRKNSTVKDNQVSNQQQLQYQPSAIQPKHRRVSERLHSEINSTAPAEKVIQKRRQTLIKLALGLPYKLAIIIFAIFLLSQTVIYVPILWVQFSTQGSGLILAAARFIPADTEISRAAKNLYPDEFERIELKYDPGPIKSTAITDDNRFKDAVNRVSPSVVRIAVSQCGGTRFGSASGVVIAPNLVMTNEHVATGASELFIVDHSGSYPAAVIVIDNDYDIAIVYSKYIDLKPVPVSRKPFLNDQYAMTMGYPGGSADLKMAIGKTSTTSINSIQNKLDALTSFQLSTGLGAGSSGGPVINTEGEIIGVNSGGNGSLLLAVRAETAIKSINAAKSALLPVINIGCQYQRSSY